MDSSLSSHQRGCTHGQLLLPRLTALPLRVAYVEVCSSVYIIFVCVYSV